VDLSNGQPYRIGDVYMMEFYGQGSAQSGLRPGVIIQNNIGNLKSPNVVAIPLTSAIKKMNLPTHVLLRASETGLRMDSVALCECPTSIPKGNIGAYITTVGTRLMKEIAIAFLLEHPVLCYLDNSEVLSVKRKSHTLIAA